LEVGYSAGKTYLGKTGHHATIIALVVTEELDDLDLHATRNHQDITTVRDMEEEVDDPGHRNEHMIIHAKETPEIQSDKHMSTDPATSGINTITRTKKL
jgi:hypothetical protein